MRPPQDSVPDYAAVATRHALPPAGFAQAARTVHAPRFAPRLDPARAFLALVIGLFAPACLYSLSQFPLVMLIAAVTLVGDRVLAALDELARQAAQLWRDRRRRSESLQTFQPNRTYAEPARPPVPARRLKPESELRPVAFVSQTDLGTRPWRLARGIDRAGVAADQALVGDLEVRAVSVVGPAHRVDPHQAQPRQDAYSVTTDGHGEFLILAVADGVSNAKHSHHGASWAAYLATRRIKDLLDRHPDIARLRADHVFPEVADGLLRMAEDWQRSPSEFATTLITAVVPTRDQGPGGRTVWIGWIADSSAWRLDGLAWRPLAGDVKQGYDPNLLSACMPNNPKRARHIQLNLPPGNALALMTDGLSDLFSDVEGAAEEFAQRWSEPPSLPEFIRDLSFDAPGQDDDRTAVLVWAPKRPGGVGTA